MIGRLLELFEGPEAPGPWAPPMMPAALHALLPWRAFDESSELYVNAGSAGFVVELPPFAGIFQGLGLDGDRGPVIRRVGELNGPGPGHGAASPAASPSVTVTLRSRTAMSTPRS